MEQDKNQVPARTITNSSTRLPYKAEWTPVRVGSQDHERIPSRFNDKLFYRDGEVKAVEQ